MRLLLLFLLSICITSTAIGQTEELLDSLIHTGIEYYDAGNYEKALKLYQQALEIDPQSEIVNYEMAITLVQTGAYYAAIEYCDKLIAKGDRYAILAYNTKGSCLNDLGKTEEAIDIFLEGIEKNNEFHLLYYNLGLAYRAQEEYEKAKDAFLTAIDLNAEHAGSHLNLGRTMMNLGRRVESLLSFYYFLFIEADSERSELAYNAIHLQLNDVTQRITDPADPFSSMDKMLSEIAQANQETGRTADMEIFIRTTGALFNELGAYRKKNNPTGLYWEFYIPFFASMTSSTYTDVFCHYISHTFERSSDLWLRDNSTRVKLFNDWLQWQ